MIRWARSGCFVIPALLAVLGLWRAMRAEPTKMPMASSACPETPAERPFAGTASCSGRSCHGSIHASSEPARPQSNEYLTWINRDPHAGAYQVLFEKRSQDIAKKLAAGGGGLFKAAHTDERCLACHSNPWTACLSESDWLREVRAYGVGCESCHGRAEKWIGPHTHSTWRAKSLEDKRAHRMMPPGDIEARIAACAGCHVGAPRDDINGLPLRDVNHDLIAAGHPRLRFEYNIFLSNLPPHWRAGVAANDVRSWAVGQVISLQQAVKLLAFRADPKSHAPWPEFAEYSCFSCHHDLAEPSWRQERASTKRKPGSLLWSTWNRAMPAALAELQKQSKCVQRLVELQVRIEHAGSSGVSVAAMASAAHDKLADLKQALLASKLDAGTIRTFILNNYARFGDANWDLEAQLYLASTALSRNKDKELHDLAAHLAFPKDFDSPHEYRRDWGQWDKKLHHLLDQLRP